MKFNPGKPIIILIAIAFLSACGNSETPVSVDFSAQANQVSTSSLFHKSTNPDYPKVHPQYYNKLYPVAVIGHRGFRTVAPENTMASFKRAYAAGVDMVELDVHLSKDREVIVMHDAAVDRTTNGKGEIRNKTLAELKTLDAGSFFSPVFKGEPIPTLDEVIDFAKDKVCVNIEIKKEAVEKNPAPGTGIEEKVAAIVAKYNMQDHVIVSSFSQEAIIRIKQINPNIPTALLIVTDGIFNSQLSLANKVKADAVNEFHTFLSKSEIEKSHKFDIHENVYTVDDPHQMGEFIDKGVDGLITDRPDLALRVLEEKYPVAIRNK